MTEPESLTIFVVEGDYRSIEGKGPVISLGFEEAKMARTTTFGSPLLLGFDHLERMIDRVQKASPEGYPPYNIEQTGDGRLRITVAVAGFSIDELQVTIEDNQLVIRGRRSDASDAERVFIHRGIATRQFVRNFVLADGINIVGASLDNGLLHVDLQQHIPKPEVRKIAITHAASASRNTKAIQLSATNTDINDD